MGDCTLFANWLKWPSHAIPSVCVGACSGSEAWCPFQTGRILLAHVEPGSSRFMYMSSIIILVLFKWQGGFIMYNWMQFAWLLCNLIWLFCEICLVPIQQISYTISILSRNVNFSTQHSQKMYFSGIHTSNLTFSEEIILNEAQVQVMPPACTKCSLSNRTI